jgi:hypothetical protein
VATRPVAITVQASNLNDPRRPRIRRPERAAWLVCVPLLATALYYTLPAALQQNPWLIFSPQLAAYAALLMGWMAWNRTVRASWIG